MEAFLTLLLAVAVVGLVSYAFVWTSKEVKVAEEVTVKKGRMGKKKACLFVFFFFLLIF